jgi:hypothetical protein
MQNSSAPLKWLYPWASQSTTIFELPATSSDPTRASQTLGFPPNTMLPPGSGGVPPQGIDFNAGLYQVSRIAWWLMYGGQFTFDSTFATNAAISGYPNGAVIKSSDLLGGWQSIADNNQNNPDVTGTNWVPAYAYGATVLSLSSSAVTLTPLQASKPILSLTGTLTANIVITVPSWVFQWRVANYTSGAYTVTITTSGGSGYVAPQGFTSFLRCDGTNVYGDLTVSALPSGVTAPEAAQFNNSTAIANTAFVQRALGNYQFWTQFNASTTLTAAQAGAGISFQGGTTGQTFTLPLMSGVLGGGSYLINNEGTTSITVAAQTGNTINMLTNTGVSNVSSMMLAPGDTISFVCSGGTTWQTFDMIQAQTFASTALTGTPTTPEPAQFDNTTKIANTAFVQRALGNFQTQAAYNASTTLLATQAGMLIVFYGSTSGLTITLPTVSTVPSGGSYSIVNQASVSVTIATSSSNTISILTPTGGSSVSTLTLEPGDSVEFISGNTTFWQTFGMAQVYMFANSLGSSNYQKFPNGAIFQWGSYTFSVTGSSTTSNTVTFPIAFPNACTSISCNVGTNTPGQVTSQPAQATLPLSKTGFTQYFYSSTTTASTTAFWTAWGN